MPLLPALRRALVAWRLRSPRTDPEHYVLCTAEGSPVSERNLRRALDQAKARAKLAVSEAERLSWHSLRDSYASILATDLELPATTLARLTGHADAGSRSASTRATGETKRQLSRTFSRGLQGVSMGRKARPRRESTETQQRRMLPDATLG